MIYVFGDSFSQRFEDFREPCTMRDYVKWKGYEPKMYFDYLSEEFKTPINNLALGGVCNEYIFMKFMEVYSEIKSDDIVIFGWTNILRFLIPDPQTNKWISNVFPNNMYLSKKTMEEIDVMRSDSLYIKKHLDLIDFIDKILPNNKVVHWSWISVKRNATKQLNIRHETDGLINDFHYGEVGHLDLYNKISEKLKIQNKVRIDIGD